MVISRSCFLGLGPLSPVVSALRAWTRLRPSRPEDTGAGGYIAESFATELSTSSPVGKLRTCVGAPSWRGRPISPKRAIGTCGTSTPTSTTPSSPKAATNQSQSTNGHRPQLKARQGRLQHQLSHSNSQAPHQVHPPPQLCPPSRLQLQAQRRHRQQRGREIRLQLQAQRFHQEPQLRARPDLHPIHQQLRASSRRKRTPPARRQPSLVPARKASTRRPRSRTFLRAAAPRSSSSSAPPARASLSSRPLILAPANCAYPTTRVDSTGIGSSSTDTRVLGRRSRRPRTTRTTSQTRIGTTDSSSDPPRGNTLDIGVEPDGAPKDWLLRTVSKLYRSHYPIQFRIISYCQARDTRESTLRFPRCATTPLTAWAHSRSETWS